jgi:hypothetical protein
MQIYKFSGVNFRKVTVKIFCWVFAILIFSCSSSKSSETTNQAKFKLEYKFGTYSGSRNNIYVIWAENPAEGFYYPIYVCARLVNVPYTLTGTALPYWKLNIYSNMVKTEVDAVTSATKQKQDFSVSFGIPDTTPHQFTVYFETDVSNTGTENSNDWFTDQPAVLYKADIDLSNLQTGYDLQFVGWTPNAYNISYGTNIYSIMPALKEGTLESETRYITNKRDSTSTTSLDIFGALDYAHAQSTQLVGSIRVIPE